MNQIKNKIYNCIIIVFHLFSLMLISISIISCARSVLGMHTNDPDLSTTLASQEEEQGADHLDVIDNNLSSQYIDSLYHNDYEAIKSLMRRHRSLFMHIFENGKTALHIAVEYNSSSGVNFLIDSGVEVNVCDQDGDTPLHLAIRTGLENIFKQLITISGIELDKANSINGWTPLMLAIKYRNLSIVKHLIAKGANVNCSDHVYEDTPLHIACEDGNKEIVEELLNNQADITKVNAQGHTPLYIAYSNNHREIIDLLESHCRVNGINTLDKDAMELLAKVFNNTSMEAIHNAIYEYQDHINKSVDNKGNTLLHIVMSNYSKNSKKYGDILKHLIKFKVNFSVMNSNLETPLLTLMRSNDGNTIENCLSDMAEGQNYNKILSLACDYQQDSNGFTLLHWAVYRASPSLISKLMTCGADAGDQFKKRDFLSHTPLGLALARKNIDTVQALLGAYRPFKEDIVRKQIVRLGGSITEQDIFDYALICLVTDKYDLNPNGINEKVCQDIVSVLSRNKKLDCTRAYRLDDQNVEQDLLPMAIKKSNIKAIELLIKLAEKMGKKQEILNRQDWRNRSDGGTLLHYACQQDDQSIVQILKDKGADIAIIDNLGRTPLYAPLIEMRIHIAELLVKCYGPKIVLVTDKKGVRPIKLAKEIWSGNSSYLDKIEEFHTNVSKLGMSKALMPTPISPKKRIGDQQQQEGMASPLKRMHLYDDPSLEQ